MHSMASGEIKCQHLFELKFIFCALQWIQTKSYSRLNNDLLDQIFSQPEN